MRTRNRCHAALLGFAASLLTCASALADAALDASRARGGTTFSHKLETFRKKVEASGVIAAMWIFGH